MAPPKAMESVSSARPTAARLYRTSIPSWLDAVATASSQLGIDVRYSLAAVGLALLTDSIAFGGAIAESAARALKPAYKTTVREHEAGHFLAAYLLGCPIEACLLDVWKAATDRRFSGAAGTKE